MKRAPTDSDERIERLQIALLADADMMASALERGDTAMAGEFLIRVEKGACAINRERTLAMAHQAYVASKPEFAGKYQPMPELRIRERPPSAFRTLVPPFTILFERSPSGDEYRATLTCAESTGGATDLTMISTKKDPEACFASLKFHAADLAEDDEGHGWTREDTVEALLWVDRNRDKYIGKFVALRRGDLPGISELVAVADTADELNEYLGDSKTELLVMEVVAKPGRKRE